MPGDIKRKYGTPITLAQTNLDGLASNATWVQGWTGALIDNTSVLAEDYIIGGEFQTESAGLSNGTILVMVYAAFTSAPTWPTLFSAGAPGVEGAATIHDAHVRDSAFTRVAALTTNTTGNRVYPFNGVSLKELLGEIPPYFAFYVAQNTGAALETTGDPNKMFLQPVLGQYT